jgi:hypothetical protein
MPIHDWDRVSAGTFHAFHTAWIAGLQKSLNKGLLPGGYYALAEQVAGETIPDVLTLQSQEDGENLPDGESPSTAQPDNVVAVAQAPPRVRTTADAKEAITLAALQRHLVIRHLSHDRIVALIEIVSPGNKESLGSMNRFVDKALSALHDGYHLLIIDLFPPRRNDPQGIHGVLWERHDGSEYAAPPGEPLTLVAYVASLLARAYVEPTAVGRELTPMPLFLTSQHYINVPLEATYNEAYEGVPERWRRVIEGRA